MGSTTAARIDIDDVLAALAEPTRMRIVEMLAHEELCVCHLTAELDLSQPLVSHHLGVLRDAGLVVGERHRYWTYYRLRRDALHELARRLEGLGRSVEPPSTRRRPCR